MNRGRPRHDDILTPREWQVLELIEAGLTNEEIASRLDISFGTAKYHVAEIISKLGVESREEAPQAAGRARAYNPAFLPLGWLQGRFALPAAGIAIASLLLLASLAVLTDIFRFGNSAAPSEEDLANAAVDFQDGEGAAAAAGALGPEPSLTSYYFEARIESDEDDVLSTVRAWYQSPDRWRFEFGDFNAGIPERGSVQVSDGQTVLFYEAETNTYYRRSVDEHFSDWPEELRGTPLFLPASLFIGPLPGADQEAFLERLTGDWILEDQGDGPEIAGRPTELLRYEVPYNGTASFWLDREHAFVLRFEAVYPQTPRSYLSVEIIDFTLNEPIDEERFGFELPGDAVEVEAPADGSNGSRGSGSSGLGGDLDPPDGFLAPSYFPDHYTSRSTQMSSSSVNGNKIASYEIRLEAAGGEDYLEVKQRYRAGGLDSSQQSGVPVDIGDKHALQRTENGALILEWSAGDTVVTLRANRLSLDELVRVAESMQ